MSEDEYIENSVNERFVYHYPLQFIISVQRGATVPFDPRSRGTSRMPPPPPQFLRPRSRRTRWSPHVDWFLRKILEDELDIIDPLLIRDEIGPTVIQKYEGIRKIDDDIFSYIKNSIEVIIDAPLLYLHGNTLGFFARDSGLFMIISNSIDEIEILVDSIKCAAQDLSSITSDLGIQLTEIYSGVDYAKYIIELKAESKLASIKIGEYKNDFEKEIHDQINKNITNSLLNNIDLSFSESADTYEYDTVICLDRHRLFQISCKDYSSVKENLRIDNISLRNNVIISPKDKAGFIDAECYVVVRGFSEKLLREFKAFGRPRNVKILDESEYLDVLQKDLITSTIEFLRSSNI